MKLLKIQIFIIACACMIGSFSLRSMAIPSAKGVQQACAKWVAAKFEGKAPNGYKAIKNSCTQLPKEGLTYKVEHPFSFERT
ncbi:MAG: hypothetical protein Q8859_13515 [Bacteroidota bacterium]|nr:hypothetical protein [Bacteroidota bacterium]